jgi:PAS domain S-box-containing protein
MTSPNERQLADFKRALDHAAIVAITDVQGRITYANDKFCEISGYARDELLGQDHRIINSGYHPPEFMRDLWRTIANGRVWHGEIRNRAKDGHFYWVDTTIVPFLDDRGKPYQYIAIRADISARKAAEETLVQQAALAQVGHMAAVVAHEVRNPLAGIKGVMQVLISRRASGDPDLTVMNDIVARIDSLSDLVDDLMLFARPRAPRPVQLRLQPLVVEAITMVRRDPAGAHVHIDMDGCDASITADAELLRAALLNLLLNAAQAVGERGSIRVRTMVTGESAAVEIHDNGPGIPVALRERVLEPFFTTKARGGGLGLPIAKRSAELHGGSLTLSYPETGGTAALLTLPLRPATPSVSTRTSRSDTAPDRG